MIVKTALVRTLSRILNVAGYDLIRNSKRNQYCYHNLLDRILLHHSDFHFIQIGGCDGKSFDPLYPYLNTFRGSITGVIVEPVASYAAEVKKLYSGYDGIDVVQKAIHAEEKSMKFYRADMAYTKQLPDYAKGVASFRKSHLLTFKIPEKYIIEDEVECISTTELIRDTGLNRLDLLQVDTEGYDGEIIKHFDFKKIKPSLIHFEHGLRDGTMDGKTFSEVVTLLNDQNYDIIIEDYDATAYLRELV